MFKSLHTNDSPLNLLDLDTIAKQTSLFREKLRDFLRFLLLLL
ncbi:hypothetical protein [Rubritalea tangerina]